MGDLLIWGASGHAAVVADIARLTGWTIAAFVDDSAGGKAGSQWLDLPVVNAAVAEGMVRKGLTHAAVAVGNPRVRQEKAAVLEAWGGRLMTLVHPRAIVAESAELGSGTLVGPGAVIGALARLGRLCIINTLASADHECNLAAAVHLCPGARLAGRVSIGEGGWVGVGACVRDRIALGAWCFVGAGAAVISDLPAGCLAFGVPAKVQGRSPYALANQKAA